MKLSKKQREELKAKYNGRCAYCGVELGKIWHADHLEPVVRKHQWEKDSNGRSQFVATSEVWHPENDTIENLMPSCPSCNVYKHAMSLEEFRREIQRTDEKLNRVSIYRMGKRFGMITDNRMSVIFHFEKVNMIEENKSGLSTDFVDNVVC